MYMIRDMKPALPAVSFIALLGIANLTGCGSSGGGDDSSGGGTTPPPVPSTTRMQAGIQPDGTGLHLVKNADGTSYRLVGHIYVVRTDGSTAATPQPPAVITLRVSNVDTGTTLFNLRMNSRVFTIVQPSGSTRPGWDFTAPVNFVYGYTPGQKIRLEAVDNPDTADDNLLENRLEWMDTTVVPNTVKVPPIEIGTVSLLGSAG